MVRVKNNPTFTWRPFIDAFDVKCECGMNEEAQYEGCIEQGACHFQLYMTPLAKAGQATEWNQIL
jgi:hypothetical protein